MNYLTFLSRLLVALFTISTLFLLIAQKTVAIHKEIRYFRYSSLTENPTDFKARSLAICQNTISVTSDADSGSGTLRQALIDVCDGGEIDFAVALTNQTIVLSSTVLTIDKTVTITNPEATNLRISGNKTNGVFIINPGQTVTMSHLSIISGTLNGGGAIFNKGTLTINDSSILDNTAFCYGGGIYNRGILTINNTTISNNSAACGGGGVYNEGGSTGTIIINNSTINSNTTVDAGGGILNESSGSITVNNSTVSDNTGNQGGGGIRNFHPDGTIIIKNSTVSGNNSNNAAGGGISNYSGILHIYNSIVANNLNDSDCHNQGTIPININNLIEDGSCNAMFSGDPNLGPLTADSPGKTATHALMLPSPAVDAGDSSTCLDTDQRGVPRPQGLTCDIGAYELLQLPQPSLSLSKTVQLSNNPIQPGETLTYTIVVANQGAEDAINVVITDTLPTYINGSNLNQTVDVTAGESITFTLNVTLSNSIPIGEVITNTAFFSHTSGSGQDSNVFSVNAIKATYLPLIMKN